MTIAVITLVSDAIGMRRLACFWNKSSPLSASIANALTDASFNRSCVFPAKTLPLNIISMAVMRELKLLIDFALTFLFSQTLAQLRGRNCARCRLS
jgi:hypothetical protein